MTAKMKKLIEKIPDKNRRVVALVLAGALAVALIVFSEYRDGPSAKSKSEAADSASRLDSEYEAELERRLEEIVSQIDSVGRVKIMVKTSSGEQSEYAVNDTLTSSSQGDTKSESEYVIIKDDGNQSGVLIKKEYPEICGVMIVCDGGDVSRVKNEVTNAVSALLGLNANRISVSKMKYTED